MRIPVRFRSPMFYYYVIHIRYMLNKSCANSYFDELVKCSRKDSHSQSMTTKEKFYVCLRPIMLACKLERENNKVDISKYSSQHATPGSK